MPTMINKVCLNCKRKFQVEIKRINAGQGKYCSVKCNGRAHYKGGHKAASKRSREKRKEKHLAYNLKYNRNYRKSIRGHLVIIFHKMVERCTNPDHYGFRWYGGRGIKCLFKNSQEFADYVIKVLKIDLRGLEIHRINNNNHYKPGNIEFLNSKEHGLKHRKAG